MIFKRIIPLIQEICKRIYYFRAVSCTRCGMGGLSRCAYCKTSEMKKGGNTTVMTALQLQWLAQQETYRHNSAVEQETNRANLANELEDRRSNVARENELFRHNSATEAESRRHNVKQESQKDREIDVTERHYITQSTLKGIDTATNVAPLLAAAMA